MSQIPSPSFSPPPSDSTSSSTVTPRVPGDQMVGKVAPLKVRSPILSHLRSVMITGLITAIPIFITVYLLSFLYALVTKFTQAPAVWIANKLIVPWVGTSVSPATLYDVITPCLAVLISIAIVYLLGLLGTFFIGRWLLAQVEHLIENLPLVKGIYGTTKQVVNVFRSTGDGHGFQRVALVEFPRVGTWTLAFVTNTVEDPVSGGKLICCFIPMTPNPTSGFFQMFPEKDVRETGWTVDVGIKIVLSGGLLAPPNLPKDTDSH